MIQRKQTLFLLVSALLMLVPLFFPYVVVTGGGALYEGDTSGFTRLGSDAGLVSLTWPLMILNILIIVAGLVTIFLYKKRVLQMRLTVFTILLKVGLYLLAALTIHTFIDTLGAADAAWRLRWVIAVIPLATIILDVIAYRAIAIDEMTVRSMYRLRGN